MSKFGSGAQRDLYYAIETVYGDGGGASPAVTEVRNTEDSISLARDSFVSDERRGDRGIHDMRLGNKQPAGDISFEFSYSAFDNFLLAALGAPYNSASVDNETVTLVALTGVLTGTGTAWVTDGFAVGDEVKVSGFSDAGNNGNFIIGAVSATEITFINPEGMVDVSVAESTVDMHTTGWVSPYTALSVLGITVQGTAKTITRAAGSFIDDGLKVGDALIVSGFTTANDQTAQITAITDLVVTLDSTTLIDATSVDTTVFDTTAVIIKKGSTVTSFAVEKAFSDLDTPEYQFYTGGVVNTLSLDVSPNSMITGSFGMIFKDAENGTSVYHGSTVDVATNRPFDAFTGYINEGGSAIAVASSMSLSLDNGFARNFVLMDDTAPQVTSGKSNVTGTITLYFVDSTVYNKFVNETESSLELQLMDDDENAYVITLPRIKYSSADTPVSSDDAIINTMNFQALDDATEGSNIVIRKQPAVVA